MVHHERSGASIFLTQEGLKRLARLAKMQEQDGGNHEFQTVEGLVCISLAVGIHNVKVPHGDRCRDRNGELMAGGGDPRQVERGSSVSTPDAKKHGVRKLERRWTWANHQFIQHPPIRCGSSRSAGADVTQKVRRKALHVGEGNSMRVKNEEPRGEKIQDDDVEKLEILSEEHLDVDMAMRGPKTDGLAGGGADASSSWNL